MKGVSRGVNLPIVLVVDDDLTMRKLVRASLEPSGFKVEELTDGLQVLSFLSHIHPDVILLDLMMPGMDGFATCTALRKLPEGEQIPVMMMTGLDEGDGFHHQAHQFGNFTPPYPLYLPGQSSI
ncbi:MAG: diguanylate cyclase [Deltaproteobacteria bacterium]|nr:diguanylate cyclase [Deltaproteobacteria bacterium]